MYNYSNSNTSTGREDDSAPLLSSSQHSKNKNYSSIHKQSIDYASLISAAVNEGDLHEQDNESIKRRQSRSGSIASLSLQQQQKFASGSSSSNSTEGTVVNNNKSILSHSYWQSIFDRYSTSLYLENKGSVARDHLANERTFLAWLRTSLSTISVGIGITQLFRLERTMTHHPPTKERTSLIDGQMIGLFFILISMMFLVFAFIRYFHTQVAMVNGFFPASRSTVTIASCLLLSPMILMLITVASR